MEKLRAIQNEPYMILEGSSIDDTQEEILIELVQRNYVVWAIPDLYRNPLRLGCIPFLKPKTLILGSTGVYDKEIDLLFHLASKVDMSSVRKIILTFDNQNNLRKRMKPFLVEYPAIKVYELYGDNLIR
jgi:hypothetical protein